MNLKRLPGENLKDYKIRLCRNKDEYGISFQDIAALMSEETGEVKGESVYRKWWTYYKEGYADAEKNLLSSDEVIEQYNEARVNAEKAMVRFRDQRNEYNRVVRERAREDTIASLLSEKLSEVEPIQIQTMPVRRDDDGFIKEDDKDLIITLSDIHYGANVKSFWNIYNPEECKRRLAYYLQQIEKIANKEQAMNCYVFEGGDAISGKLHSQRYTDVENLIEQVKNVSELISWFVAQLSGIFKNVYFLAVSGNHSRLDPNKMNAVKGEQLEEFIPWYVEARLQNLPNVTVAKNEIDNTLSYVKIRNKGYLLLHGDKDKFSDVLKIVNMVGGDVYSIFMGHMHHNKIETVDGYKVIMSGSVMGMDDYTIDSRIYGVAEQLVAVVDVHGIVCYYDIPLQ